MKTYKDLTVWQKSIELVEKIYKLSDEFPKSEIFGLTSQMRRSSISIPSNIAEGYSRKHNKEFHQFIKTAYGSAAELETQIIISKKLKLAELESFKQSEMLLDEILRMLNKLASVLHSKN